MTLDRQRYLDLEARMKREKSMLAPILLVEDDEKRVSLLKNWLPPVFRLVHCKTGGAALGLLERSSSWDFSGVMLDHDLQQQMATNQ